MQDEAARRRREASRAADAAPRRRPRGVGAGPISGRSAREIVESVEAAVAARALEPGARLASVRGLATELGVAPGTVAAAMSELRRRGIVVSRPRSGLRVAERPPLARPQAAAPEGVRDLSTGNPDPAFLPDVWSVLRRSVPPAPPRVYGDEPVIPELRAVAAAALRADAIDAAHLCVLGGALDGIERTLQAHLAAGDRVAVEDPGFAGVLDLVRALGLVPAPVAMDDRGMLPNALNAALREGARAVIVTPRGQNPTGAALDPRRARELAGVMDGHPSVLLVEDDHLGPVAGAPAYTLTAGRATWAAIRSTSKWLGPDLRLSVLAGDQRTVARVEGRQAVGQGWVSTILQRAVAAMWADEETLALADQAATVYAGRRRRLVQALRDASLSATGESGLNVWVAVPDEDAAMGALLAAGWAVAPGSRFRISTPPAVRITSSTLRPDEADRLAADLTAAMRPARTRSG